VGYRRKRKEYRLRFETPDMAGFEVTVKGLSSGGFLRLTKAAAAAAAINIASVQSIGDGVPAVGDMFDMLAENIVAWNLEGDDGTPLPVTAETIRDQEYGFVMAIAEAWMSAIAGVAPPLPASSNGGGRFPEASIPMATFPPSRSS
jgi:hypothetical protein